MDRERYGSPNSFDILKSYEREKIVILEERINQKDHLLSEMSVLQEDLHRKLDDAYDQIRALRESLDNTEHQ
jgi:hypothetical protein